MVVRVLSGADDVLVAHVEGLLVGHPVAAADADGVAAVEVAEGVHAVGVALPVTALEVAPLIENDLQESKGEKKGGDKRESERRLQYRRAACRGQSSPLNNANVLHSWGVFFGCQRL